MSADKQWIVKIDKWLLRAAPTRTIGASSETVDGDSEQAGSQIDSISAYVINMKSWNRTRKIQVEVKNNRLQQTILKVARN